MRLCAAGFTSSQRNPRYREKGGRSILTSVGRTSVCGELQLASRPRRDTRVLPRTENKSFGRVRWDTRVPLRSWFILLLADIRCHPQPSGGRRASARLAM